MMNNTIPVVTSCLNAPESGLFVLISTRKTRVDFNCASASMVSTQRETPFCAVVDASTRKVLASWEAWDGGALPQALIDTAIAFAASRSR